MMITHGIANTVQSNYNFTHALCVMRGTCMFYRGQRNNYMCTYL